VSAQWESLKIELPLKPLLEPVLNVMETMMVYLEILKAILETIKALLIDFGNPIKALVQALIALIQQLFKALQQTGLYTYYDFPDPTKLNFKTNYNRFANISQPFTYRLSGSWYNPSDQNRPQPVKLFNQGAYLLFVVDASSVVKMIRLIIQLLKFFGKDFTQPRFQAMRNVKALPLGDKKDPILALSKVFSGQVKGIAVEWSIPSTQRNPDPGMADVVGELADEFIPPAFLIEKSTQPLTTKIDTGLDTSGLGATKQSWASILAAFFKDGSKAGICEYTRGIKTETPQSGGKLTPVRVPLVDELGEPVIKFEKYIVVDNFLDLVQASLGKFRWIDTDVKKDTTYFYRVRAYTGSLDYSTRDATGYTTLTAGLRKVNYDTTTVQMGFNGKTGEGEPVMGRASAIVQARIPDLPAKFDVESNVYRLLLVALSLDFGQQAIIVKDAAGNVTRPQFNGDGGPMPGTSTVPSDIGRGKLAGVSGPLNGGYSASSVLQLLTPSSPQMDSATMPWQVFLVKYQAQRLTATVLTAFLTLGSGPINKFKDLMQGALPWGALEDIEGTLKGANDLETLCIRLTEDPPSRSTRVTFEIAYDNISVRCNIQKGVQTLIPFLINTSSDPAWSSIKLFDFVPWVPTILYKLLDVIEALLDAYKGVVEEIKDFIDLLLRKINALERFIKFLIQIIESILDLEVSCYFLNSGVLDKGIDEWDSVLWNAGGDAPPYVFGGYSAGIALAAVGPDISNIVGAFKLLFGG
jgi:hypothetical protein